MSTLVYNKIILSQLEIVGVLIGLNVQYDTNNCWKFLYAQPPSPPVPPPPPPKKKKKKKKKKKSKRKVQGVPQSQTAALPRSQEEVKKVGAYCFWLVCSFVRLFVRHAFWCIA